MFHMTGAGFLTVLLAGVVQGSVLTPMPYLKKWSWENIWLVYSTAAYLILPWPFALLTVPHLFSAFGAVPSNIIMWTLALGFVWGLAVVLYGLGIDMLGLALGTAIILGLGTSVGSVVPLIGQHRDKLWAPSGLVTLAGVFLLTIAVVLFALAGNQREQILKARSGQSVGDTGLVRSGRFLAGLLICILCGFLSPLFNIIFAYSAEIQKQAIIHGANPTSAGNAVWLLVANAGFLPSLFYCLYLLKKNGTWSTYQAGMARYWFLAPLMSLMWISCLGWTRRVDHTLQKEVDHTLGKVTVEHHHALRHPPSRIDLSCRLRLIGESVVADPKSGVGAYTMVERCSIQKNRRG